MTIDTFDRRDFLRRAGLTGAVAAATTLVGPGRPPARADESLAPFLHGVASGDPLADQVILWTRITTAGTEDVPVRWIVATDVELNDVVASGEVAATATRDWTVKVDAAGLSPHSWYFFAFEALGKRSLVGRTKTAPAAGQAVDHLRYAVVSCSSYQHGYFNAYARIAARDDLDAVIHTGDYLYEYGPGEYGDLRAHEPAKEYVTLDDYRTRHAQYKLDPDLRRLHQLFPFVTTWDDHESTDNSYRDGANNHDDTEGEWSQRKATAQRVYDEWMPIRSSGDPNIIYRHLAWGDLVDVIVLDTRLEGRDEQLKYPGTDTEALGLLLVADDPDRRIMSDEQMSWLQERLRTSSATWKIVAQQVILSGWNAGGLPRFPIEGPDTPLFVRDGGNALNPDAWDGYNHQRLAFLDFLKTEGIDNTIVLTGDVHSSWAFDITPDPFNPVTDYNPVTGEGAVGVEFVAPAITSPPLGETFGGGTQAQVIEQAFLSDNPQMKMSEIRSNGYIVLDITPDRAQADWFFVDTVTEVSDTESFHAGWFAPAGANHLTQASAAATAAEPAPAIPAATPPPGSQAPTDPQSDVGGSGSLPSTGGGSAALGAAAILGAIALRRRAAALHETDEQVRRTQ
jgi:alkaline phosphatase D